MLCLDKLRIEEMDEQKLKDYPVYIPWKIQRSKLKPLPHAVVNTLLTHTRLEKSKVSALQTDFPYHIYDPIQIQDKTFPKKKKNSR